MFDHLIAPIAPHPCCGCGKIGALLCDNCNYNISSDAFYGCILCGASAGLKGVCESCAPPFSRAWCVGERSGELKKLIDDFKFERVRAAHKPLARLLCEQIGQLPEDAVVVPVPTVAAHVRQRGYDHALLLARAVAKYQGAPLKRLLVRSTASRQRGATKTERDRQASRAFKARGTVEPGRVYVIVDDITTTGATLRHAARVLRGAGANEVWVAAVARQPLD